MLDTLKERLITHRWLIFSIASAISVYGYYLLLKDPLLAEMSKYEILETIIAYIIILSIGYIIFTAMVMWYFKPKVFLGSTILRFKITLLAIWSVAICLGVIVFVESHSIVFWTIFTICLLFISIKKNQIT